MTIANDSILVTPGSGASAATHTPSGQSKEWQGTVDSDEYGHIEGTQPTYKLWVPAAAAGANKVFFDLFNATGSGKTLKILSVAAIKDGSVAVTGTLSCKFFLTRTTAVGTGGTAATNEGTTTTGAVISAFRVADGNVPAQVTARGVPSGGATAGAVLAERHVFTEETNGATYDPVEFLPSVRDAKLPTVIVPENTGIRVVQGGVASVGNIAFEVVFEVL